MRERDGEGEEEEETWVEAWPPNGAFYLLGLSEQTRAVPYITSSVTYSEDNAFREDVQLV